jgi:putative ABC transport system ATP-binding protein
MISVKDLTYEYPTGGFQLSIPKLEISAGRRVAIIGPSGSGKTTLLNILAGVYPAAGSIEVVGARLDQMPDRERRRFRAAAIGFVFQDFGLIDYLNARDNILHPYRIGLGQKLDKTARGNAEQLVTNVGLENRLHHFPQQLSQGEKQRVAICRALVTKPSLVLADEPTGNLDASTKMTVLETLLNETKEVGATLIIVTHDNELLPQFDEVIDFKQFVNQVRP